MQNILVLFTRISYFSAPLTRLHDPEHLKMGLSWLTVREHGGEKTKPRDHTFQSKHDVVETELEVGQSF